MSEQREPMEKQRADAPADDEAARLRFQGIVETGGEGAEVETGPRAYRSTPVAGNAGGKRRGGANWTAMARQTLLVSRLIALFWLFAVFVGWPFGTWLAHRANTGSGEGFSLWQAVSFESFLLAIVASVLTLLLGYMASRLLHTVRAAETIAHAANQLISPDAAAADNVRQVGAALRGQMDALNMGLDHALARLAAVEAMIRQHVEAIEIAGGSMEARASGAVARVAEERARLIDLTEQLNAQADAFAAAIAAKAQASIEALHSADDISERAQEHLDERLRRLDTAAQNALQSFTALGDALHAADHNMRVSTERIAASSEEARHAAETAATASIEAAARATERAASEAVEAAEREAQRVAAAASGALESVKRSTAAALASAIEDADKASNAAERIAETATRASETAAKASADISRASESAQRSNEQAEARNRALAEARAALEEENTRLESLIAEQRARADRLADAIAAQTERLSRLAEAQLREQEASAHRPEEKAERRVEADEEAHAPTESRHAEELQRIQNETEAAAAAEARRAGQEAAPRPRSAAEATAAQKAAENAASSVLDLGAAEKKKTSTRNGGASRQRLDELADDIAQRRKDPPRGGDRRDKQSVSWREILDATDEADPLDLAAASVSPPQAVRQAQPDSAANAIRIISELQSFTQDLEARLYGEPPPALRERFSRGDRNVFANRLLRLNESDVKRRIRAEAGRDKAFERDVHSFLQGFERLLEDATTSETADEELEEYLSSPLGRVYLLIGATVGYFA